MLWFRHIPFMSLYKMTDARFSHWPFPAKLRHSAPAPASKPAGEGNLVHGACDPGVCVCVFSPTSTPRDPKKGSTIVKSIGLPENVSGLQRDHVYIYCLRKMAKVRFGWQSHCHLGVMRSKLKYQSLQSISKIVTPCGSSLNGLRRSRRDWQQKRPGRSLYINTRFSRCSGTHRH